MARKKKPPKPKKPKIKKPPKPKKPKKVHARHASVNEGKSTPASGGEPKGLTPSGGTAAKDLEAPASTAGLADQILDLVGEGVASLRAGLMAWQREQDRVANRAWRRPGGMARMGNL